MKQRVRLVLTLSAGGALALGSAWAVAQSTSSTPFGTPTAAVPTPGRLINNVRGDRASGWVDQTRSEVVARHGMVATSQPLAAQAGLDMLKKGGNAVDAAVAAAAELALMEPESTGLGGDLFAEVYSADDRKLYGLNASGWAPAGWTRSYFTGKGYTGAPPYTGIDSATVPGAVDGWAKLLDRFGTMKFKQVLAPAVRDAEQGFPVTERIHTDWRSGVSLLRRDADSAAAYLVNNQAPPLYSIYRNPDLANTFRVLQKKGRDAFYEGEIAKAIVAKEKALGGVMTLADLSEYESEWVDPLSSSYHGYDIYEMPPNSQGFGTLEMLNIVEQCAPVLGFDMAALGARSPQFWHLLIEAKKLAFTDLDRYLGDPRFEDIPLAQLTSKEYARSLCSQIDPAHASTPAASVDFEGGTVYIATADRWGNMVSFIYSIYDVFGSGVTVPGYGFLLHNRGALFNLDPSSPNVVGPRKRPFHTIIPAFVMKDGQPVMAFGNMGGSVQVQAQATELVFMIDLGLNVQAAGDAARFRHDQEPNRVQLESKLYDLVGSQLAGMGHSVRRTDGSLMGGYQAILFTPDPNAVAGGEDPPVPGVYRAGSDFRKDGLAIGW
jgi:gamma-glutamyltranspeptidase / glutathione hydrolase